MSSRKKLTTKLAIRGVKCGLLLQNVNKCVEHYFRFYSSESNDAHITGGQFTVREEHLEQIALACVDILLYGLKLTDEKCTTSLASSPTVGAGRALGSSPLVSGTNTLQKLIDDFEWLRRSTQIGEARVVDASDAVDAGTKNFSHAAVQKFLHTWTLRNLQSNCLCACLQALAADKELLDCYYTAGAFLRSIPHATSFFICISALELNQCSLLTQVNTDLCSPTMTGAFAGAFGGTLSKRACSHPDFFIATSRNPLPLTSTSAQRGGAKPKVYEQKQTATKFTLSTAPTVFRGLRKVKSLPSIPNLAADCYHSSYSTQSSSRPRSKTLSVAATFATKMPPSVTPTQPKNIPSLASSRQHLLAYSSNTNSSSSYSGCENEQPSTSSSCSKRSQLVQHNKHSPTSSTATTATAASNSTSVSSTISATTARRIELIKCDDIKIWTDHCWEQKHQQKEQQQSTPQETSSSSCDIPRQALIVKPAKSTSPINNFLCQLFGTPPTYTSWSQPNLQSFNDETETTPAAALDASYPCNTHQMDASSGGGVFDAFLPVYGKKLRSRKSQSLFDEDGVNNLDYTSTIAASSLEEPAGECVPISKVQPKSCQSLTAFLQMAQLSTQRNNTDLEKENAHFRISEAIISAIERIKWTNQEPGKWRSQSETATTATDWLEKDRNNRPEIGLTPAAEVNEHMPYTELGDCSADALSAEVVGLSLISKFNDKHLPKMSELKWLVSEEDAPQALLPIPDTSSTCNPDENVAPSITRGTRYWAPPRQQIIFTDHPPANRKDLIRKQNNRCAGCGMRVSPQHMQSFRYCTYLGKYHCTACHRNQMSATPAKILQSWDFKGYPVSVFAYRLLEQMYTYPLFYVPDLNAALYIRSKVLLAARNKRLQLKFVKDFIKNCRFAVREQRYFDSMPSHITDDPDIWSMADFMDAHEKSMKRSIDELIFRCENHIFNCVLCTARGFICECCSKEEVIYPWQNKVVRCDRCGSCFHQKCWKSKLETCCRCQRMNKRQVELNENEIAYETIAKIT